MYKKRLLSILFFLSFFSYSLLSADIIIVDTTGTGNYTTIQEGINASTDGDTVLVYPGTYYENINFNGKNITVTSLYIIIEADSFIHQTIIDGNQNGSVVKIVSGEDENTILCGFTIQNGSGSLIYGFGYDAGGIGIIDSNPQIKKCIIKNNTAMAGGGIFCGGSQITLSGVTIFNNHAFSIGGGIILLDYSAIDFDTDILSNIYLNYAGRGCEFHKSSTCPPLEIVVDTFTVMNPDSYFVTSVDLYGYPVYDVTMNILHAKIEPVNADLYVSPDGDNINTGITPDEPLQTIAFALTKIASDSLHPNTVHITAGVYSPSLNDEKFPLNLRSYVSLLGESMENTILNGEGLSYLINNRDIEKDYSIINITIMNGYHRNIGGLSISLNNENVILENIAVHNCEGSGESGMLISNTDNLILRNIYIYDNCGGLALGLGSVLDEVEREFLVENCVVRNNLPDDDPDVGDGGGILVAGRMTIPDNFYGVFKNVQITNNVNVTTDWFGSSVALTVINNAKVDVINATIGDNTTPTGGAVKLDWGAEVNIINSILYGDTPREIFLGNSYGTYEHPSTVTIRNSLIQGGLDSIWDYGGFNNINWEDGNLYENPFWIGEGDFPYALSDSSCCIDSGTIDTTGLNLPEYDLAGNPRISCGRIDMGAYEWQDTHAVYDWQNQSTGNVLFQNYPNPFSNSTTISFNLNKILAIPMIFYKQINLEIYNVRGQLVKQLSIDNHSRYISGSIKWDGKDKNGKELFDGVYLYRLQVDNYKSELKKMILIK